MKTKGGAWKRFERREERKREATAKLNSLGCDGVFCHTEVRGGGLRRLFLQRGRAAPGEAGARSDGDKVQSGL